MASRTSPPALLTPREAAARVGVGTRTLATWAADGTLPRRSVLVLPSGHRRYVAGAIDALAAKRRRA
jgi:predicted site-specific integrase-resolvase